MENKKGGRLAAFSQAEKLHPSVFCFFRASIIGIASA